MMRVLSPREGATREFPEFKSIAKKKGARKVPKKSHDETNRTQANQKQLGCRVCLSKISN